MDTSEPFVCKCPGNPQVSATLCAQTRAVLEAMIKTQKKRMRLRGRSQLSVLFWEGTKEHHSIQPAHTPPTTTTTTLPCIFQPSNETLGAAETLSYHRTAAQWWAAPAATEQIFTDVGGGDRLKEDAAVSMRASFISKIQFIHACLSASSHCNIYIHGGTSHPFPPFHLVPFSPSIMPTSRLCTQSSTQTLTATWAFIEQTALHLSRGGERGGRGERGSGTRAFFCLKRHLRLLRWEAGLQRNIKHLRLRGEEQRETMKLRAVCQMTSYLRVIPSH